MREDKGVHDVVELERRDAGPHVRADHVERHGSQARGLADSRDLLGGLDEDLGHIF